MKSIIHSPDRYNSIVANIASGKQKVDMWATLVQRESKQHLYLAQALHDLTSLLSAQQDLIGLARDIEARKVFLNTFTLFVLTSEDSFAEPRR